jgi:long-chain acyl-CoA synthetase
MTRTQTRDTIPFEQARTLAGLFLERCRRTPRGEAYRASEPRRGWVSFTWWQVHEAVERWKAALSREGLEPGERVAILLRNSVEWVCFDQAAHALGLVVVPLYPTDNPGNIAYILGDCGARVLLLGDEERWHTLSPLRANFPALQRVVSVAPPSSPHKDILLGMQAWLSSATGPAQDRPRRTDDLATIVYTSGTTGKPKGVMLSHRNILSNCDGVLQVVDGYLEDVFLSFLPLSHMLERTCGYYVPMTTGSCVAFARSVQDLAQDLETVQPTMLVSVPRIYERIYAKLQQQLEEKGAPARKLFEAASAIGWKRFEAEQHRGDGPGTLQELAWPVLRHLVADKLLSKLGGRLRIAVSGGAPVSSKLMHTFIGLGLPVLQGYGLTESSPIVTANRLEDNVPESVGRPIPGVEVKLGAQDELLVRGPNVMMGYWNAPEKTREAINPDGWLHTGDVGRIEGNGHVYIVGRLKEIVVTSTGEKFPPTDLELAILEDPLFDQVMVIGESRPFVSALVVLNSQEWPVLAQSAGVDAGFTSLAHAAVRQAVLQRLESRLASFPSYARVRGLWLTLEPWTTDNGLVTPTLKLRRRLIEQRFSGEIESLYAQRRS